MKRIWINLITGHWYHRSSWGENLKEYLNCWEIEFTREHWKYINIPQHVYNCLFVLENVIVTLDKGKPVYLCKPPYNIPIPVPLTEAQEKMIIKELIYKQL